MRNINSFFPAFLYGLMLAPLLALTGQPVAQPLPVPTLPPGPAFQSTDLDPLDQKAAQELQQGGFEATMHAGAESMLTAREIAADLRIQNEILGVNGWSDFFHKNPEYRDYLLKELEIQKHRQLEDWELLMLDDLERRRETNVERLGNANVHDTGEIRLAGLREGQAALDRETLEERERAWRAEHEQMVAAGFHQYQMAFANLYQDRASFLDEMGRTEARFQANLNKINGYEKTVRDGILAATGVLAGELAGNDLFYVESYDGTNKMNVDRGQLNPAGLELQQILNDMNTMLANGAPVSILTRSLADYLDRQKARATLERDKWQNLIRGRSGFSLSTGLPHDPRESRVPMGRNGKYRIIEGAPFQAGVHYGNIPYGSISANPLLNGIVQFVDKKDGTALKNSIAGLGEFRVIEGFHGGTRACGDSVGQINFNQGPMGGYCTDGYIRPEAITASQQANRRTFGHEMFGMHYVPTWRDAFLYIEASVCCPKIVSAGVGEAIFKNQTSMTVQVNYGWYDPNAEANRDTWQGYLDTLGPLLTHWRDELLPSIEKWEAQAARYRQDHADWQNEAVIKRNRMEQQYRAGQAVLNQSRNNWLARISEIGRKGERNFEDLVANVPDVTVSMDTGSEKYDHGGNVPDYSLLDGVTEQISRGLRAAFNLGQMNAQEYQAETRRRRTLESLAKKIESHQNPIAEGEAENQPGQLYVTMTATGIKATRYVHTGVAKKHEGASGTSASHYYAEYEQEELEFSTPAAIKLSRIEDLFNRDEKAEDAFKNNIVEYAKAEAAAEKLVDAQLAGADATARAKKNLYDQEVSAQVMAAQEAEDSQMGAFGGMLDAIGQTMFGGLDFSSALKQTFTEYSQSIVQQGVARATGLPVGFVGGYAAGLPPHEAARQHYVSEAYTTFEQQMGIEGASVYLGEKLAEQEEDRKKRDAYRGVNVAAQIRYGATSRAVVDNVVGLASGELLREAVGLPVTQWLNPLGTENPLSVEGLSSLADNAEDLRTGRTTTSALKQQFTDNVRANQVAGGEQLRNVEKWQTKDVGKSFTGIISAGVTPVMNTFNAAFMPPEKETTAGLAFRQIVSNTLKKSTGIQPAYIEGMIVHGEDQETAATRGIYENLLDQHGMLELEHKLAERGIPGLESMLREKVSEYNTHIKARRAAQLRAEDGLLGLPYIWRNAQYDQTTAMMSQSVELGAGIALAAAISAGTAGVGSPAAVAYMIYMGTKQGYLGSREGGTVGAIAGVGSGIGNAYLGLMGTGASANLTYSNETGFGANMGYGFDAGGGMTLGGFAQMSEGQGITGYGVNMGISNSPGAFDPRFGAALSLNFDAKTGEFQGGGLKGTMGDNMTGSVGYHFDQVGGYSGTSLEGSYAWGSLRGGSSQNYQTGVGLMFNREGTTDVTVSQHIGVRGMGPIGVNAGVSNTWKLGTRGNVEDVSQAITVGFKFSTRAQALSDMKGDRKKLLEELADERAKETGTGDVPDYDRIEEINEHLKAIDLAMKKMDPTLEIRKYEAEKLAKKIRESGKPGADEDLAKIWAAHKEGRNLSDKERHDLALEYGAGSGEVSRGTGLWDSFTGAMTDAWSWATGEYSSVAGKIDPNTGEWRQATCFTKGTNVWTEHGPKNIEDIKVNDKVWSWNEYYNRLELNRVVMAHVRKTKEIYRITYADGQVVETTWSHPFFVEGKGKVKGKDLRPGDVSVSAKKLPGGNRARLLRMASYAGNVSRSVGEKERPALEIVRIEIIQREETVHNFEVEGAHTYFVGGQDGEWALVHNAQYEVEPGEGLQIVSKKTQVTLGSLLEANPDLLKRPKKGGDLKKGETLEIPDEMLEKVNMVQPVAQAVEGLNKRIEGIKEALKNPENMTEDDILVLKRNLSENLAAKKRLETQIKNFGCSYTTNDLRCGRTTEPEYKPTMVDKVQAFFGLGGGKEKAVEPEQTASIPSGKSFLRKILCFWCSDTSEGLSKQEVARLMEKKVLSIDERKNLIGHIFKDKGVEPEMVMAILKTEGAGHAFDKKGRPIIRFEAHRFDPNRNYNDKLKWGGPNGPWTNHKFKKADGKWVSYHSGNMRGKKNDLENQAMDWAKSINKEKAYRSTSIGAPQIMGKDFRETGFNSAEEMYEKFSQSEGIQYKALRNWIDRVKGKKLWNNLKKRQFSGVACRYNGCGRSAAQIRKRAKYARDLQQNYDYYKNKSKRGDLK